MEATTQFDLTASLNLWLKHLAQSPHFRNENVAEMESHVRDSVTTLQCQGLSEEESFLIAIRRVGRLKKLAPEFAKVNRNFWNHISHGLILGFITVGCGFLWALLQLAEAMGRSLQMSTPAFSYLLIKWAALLAVPPLLAAAYCAVVWFRKINSSWMGFFATSVATLFLLTPITLVALLLPILKCIENLGGK